MRPFVFFLFLCNCLIGQSLDTEIAALKDSILMYKNSDPDKAITFGFEVLNSIDLIDPTSDFLSVNTLIGEILFYRNLDAEALRFYDESLSLFEALPVKKRQEKEVNFPPWVLINIGNVYFKNSNFDKAKDKYKEAIENFKRYKNKLKQAQGLATANDNLALIALKEKDYNQAEAYLNTSYNLRKNTNKIEDIIYSNFGFLKIYMIKDDLFKINSLFGEIEKLFESEKNNYSPEQLSNSYLLRNYAYSYSLMGDYYKSKGNYTTAIDYFRQAKKLLKNFPVEIPALDVNITESYLAQNQWEKAKVSAQSNLKKIKGSFFQEEKKRNFKVLEKVYQHTADSPNLIRVKDSLIKMASFGTVLNLGNKFNELESNILLAKKRAELNESKIMYNTYLFILIIGSTILLFSLISLRLNFNLQKEKAEKISAEKKYFKSALEHKKMELINKSNYISQRNQNLNYILDSVDKIDPSKQGESTAIIKEKIGLLLKSDGINKRFEKQFEEIYPNFFKKLIEKSDRLSQNDLRLCAYLKMNQNTHEIAQLSGVSLRTIESQKYRLKKKLNLSKEENLISYLMKL